MGISSDFKYSKSFLNINGKNLAYVDSGEGDPALQAKHIKTQHLIL